MNHVSPIFGDQFNRLLTLEKETIMNNVLWILQILLALAFTMTGLAKLTQPKEKLATMMGWVNDFPPNIIKVIGLLELLGAIGLILPALTNILPSLTILAAAGLVVTMLGAAATHLRRKEYPMIGANMVLLVLALIVAYGRWMIVPL
jgi:uncharacterized membrane protein YphA (DoxX/SURF4 family)